MTDSQPTASVARLRANLAKVAELMAFDDLLLGVVLQQLRRIATSQTEAKINNPRHRVDSLIGQLERIRENQSLRSHYGTIYNQCVVLAVSHFGSAVRELFIDAVDATLTGAAREELLSEEIKVPVRELVFASLVGEMSIGAVLADAKDVSFQDMQSIARAFKQYLGVETPSGIATNNVICGQGMRHVIVHNGSIVDDRALRQLRSTNPRTIQLELVAAKEIQFSREEVQSLCDAMRSYLDRLCELLRIKGISLPT